MKKRRGIFQKNGWWWIDYRDTSGQRHREKASPTAEGAWQKYVQVVSAIERGERLGLKQEGITFEEFITTFYWKRVAPTWSPGERTRTNDILENALYPFFRSRPLAKTTRDDVEEWLAERAIHQFRGHPISAYTLNKELTRLRHIFKRAVQWGYLLADPSAGIQKRREPPGRVRYLTPAEEHRLLKDAPADLYAYTLWAIETGARREELTRLTWGDVDFHAGLVTLLRTKNGKPRYVPLTTILRAWLREQPRSMNPADLLLPPMDPRTLTVKFGRHVRKLGLVDLRLHDLRHHTASILAQHGVSQRAIMEQLGHRDPRMSTRYQHLAPGYLKEVQDALEGHRAGTTGTADVAK